jgi:hypothetical protein
MMPMLTVHTSGELMVMVPDAVGALMPNDIYYGNRFTEASALGEPVPAR